MDYHDGDSLPEYRFGDIEPDFLTLRDVMVKSLKVRFYKIQSMEKFYISKLFVFCIKELGIFVLTFCISEIIVIFAV